MQLMSIAGIIFGGFCKDHDNHHKYFIYNYGAGLNWFERFHGTRWIDNHN